jgi:hypothetical protein
VLRSRRRSSTRGTGTGRKTMVIARILKMPRVPRTTDKTKSLCHERDIECAFLGRFISEAIELCPASRPCV